MFYSDVLLYNDLPRNPPTVIKDRLASVNRKSGDVWNFVCIGMVRMLFRSGASTLRMQEYCFSPQYLCFTCLLWAVTGLQTDSVNITRF